MMTLVRITRRCGARAVLSALWTTGLTMAFLATIILSGCTASLSSNSSGSNGATGLVASSTSVTFGSVAVGQTASLSLTLTNQGTTAVKISQVSVSGQSFTASGQSGLPATIAANGTFSLTLQFNPTATGTASGQVTVTSSEPERRGRACAQRPELHR
jgi:hypothetical protein